MSKVPTRDEWQFGHNLTNIMEDKDLLISTHICTMLNRATQMFEYDNLPKTIKKKDLELQLLCHGFTIWKKVDGEWYTFFGGLGGQPNPYYLPTKAIIANPALRYNASLEIDDECVVMLNDNLYQGILPTLTKYANLLVEAELTLKYAILNARIPMLLTADSDTAYANATNLVEKVVKGEDYGIVVQTPTQKAFEGINTFDFCKTTHIKDIIEAVQYIKGSEYNEIGINAAFNMKREAINEAEATLNEDILYPLCDVFLECRRNGLELVNAKLREEGLPEITVRFSSVWEQNRHHEELVLDTIEAEIDVLEAQADTTEESEVKSDENQGNSDDTTDSSTD